jgi:methyl-accepting chemotaxis protein
MKFTDFKIGTRLGSAFGLVVLLSLASAGLALNKLSAIETSLEDVVKDNNVKIQINNDLSQSVHVISRVIRTVTLLSDQDEKEREAVKINKARDAYDKAWDALQKFPASEAGKANRAKILAARDAARPINNKVIDLAMADKDAEAIALLLKEASPAVTKWQETIGENISFQEGQNEKQYEQAVANYTQARNLLVGANVVSVLLAVLLGWRVTRSITVPMNQALQVAKTVAAGDLSSRIEVNSSDETGQLLRAMKEMQESLTQVVSTVRQGSDSVATASAQIASGNNDLSQRTEEQASALQQTAASMEQLSTTVKQNADNAIEANQLARIASATAVQGGEVVAQVVGTMKGINESSKKISDIISVIDGIAFQTNILALNAAVEAARAGEQGRGFAVVATEVRSLAGRSAEAAKEIKSLINASVERVDQGTLLVDQAGATMTEVVSSIRRVTDMMGEISAASAEQSQGVAQIGEAVQQMDTVTQQNAALVEEMAAAASSLQSQAQDLVGTVAVFNLGTNLVGTKSASQARPKPVAIPVPVSIPTRSVQRTLEKPAKPFKPLLATAAAATGGDANWTSF